MRTEVLSVSHLPLAGLHLSHRRAITDTVQHICLYLEKSKYSLKRERKKREREKEIVFIHIHGETYLREPQESTESCDGLQATLQHILRHCFWISSPRTPRTAYQYITYLSDLKLLIASRCPQQLFLIKSKYFPRNIDQGTFYLTHCYKIYESFLLCTQAIESTVNDDVSFTSTKELDNSTSSMAGGVCVVSVADLFPSLLPQTMYQ